MLNYEAHQVGNKNVVAFRGKLDAITVPEVRARIEQVFENNPGDMIVDLSKVDSIDSTGVALVVSIFKRLRAIGGKMKIAGVQGQPREIFAFLKLDQSLPLSKSVEEALLAF